MDIDSLRPLRGDGSLDGLWDSEERQGLEGLFIPYPACCAVNHLTSIGAGGRPGFVSRGGRRKRKIGKGMMIMFRVASYLIDGASRS